MTTHLELAKHTGRYHVFLYNLPDKILIESISSDITYTYSHINIERIEIKDLSHKDHQKRKKEKEHVSKHARNGKKTARWFLCNWISNGCQLKYSMSHLTTKTW